jgi:hypothetical protein
MKIIKIREVPMPPKRQNFKGKSLRNVMHRMTQAERARTVAAQFGPSVVADILEVHAQCCERNAAKMVLKGPRRRK